MKLRKVPQRFSSHIEEVVAEESAFYRVAAVSSMGPEKARNDDRFFFAFQGPDQIIAAVADGVGSTPLADQAAESALKALSATIIEDGLSDGTVLKAIDRANQSVLDLGVGAATTLIAVVILGDKLRYFCVGDSIAMILGGRGKVKVKSRGHSAYDLLTLSGVAFEEDETHENMKSELVTYLGSHHFICETSKLYSLKDQDTILIGSDGLFDNLKDGDLTASTASKKDNVRDITAALKDKAAERMQHSSGKQDDATVIVIRKNETRAS